MVFTVSGVTVRCASERARGPARVLSRFVPARGWALGAVSARACLCTVPRALGVGRWARRRRRRVCVQSRAHGSETALDTLRIAGACARHQALRRRALSITSNRRIGLSYRARLTSSDTANRGEYAALSGFFPVNSPGPGAKIVIRVGLRPIFRPISYINIYVQGEAGPIGKLRRTPCPPRCSA